MTTTLVILLLSLLALLLLSLLAYAAGRAGHRKAAPQNSGGAAGSARSDAGGTDSAAPRQRPEGCCGQHETCERESLLAAVSREVEYFDDEELDAFLFSLGCYTGEPITVVSRLKGGCVVSIKDARYNIDVDLARAISI